MYHVIGIQRSGERVLAGTPATAAAALTHYRAAQAIFRQVVVQSPEGEEIDGFELSRRAQNEMSKPYN